LVLHCLSWTTCSNHWERYDETPYSNISENLKVLADNHGCGARAQAIWMAGAGAKEF